MKAREVMTTPVITVEPPTPAKDAAALLATHRITALPVVAAGRLVGIVSESDLLRRRIPPDPLLHLRRDLPAAAPPPSTVDEAMTAAPVTATEDTDTAQVAELMRLHRVHSVPVVRGTAVVGIVSRGDLLRLLTREP